MFLQFLLCVVVIEGRFRGRRKKTNSLIKLEIKRKKIEKREVGGGLCIFLFYKFKKNLIKKKKEKLWLGLLEELWLFLLVVSVSGFVRFSLSYWLFKVTKLVQKPTTSREGKYNCT